MASNPKPTILLIQGAFQQPNIYYNLVDGLKARAYEVVHPALPSISDQDSPEFPSRTIMDDAAVVEGELVKLVVEQGKTVVVVMHSYGGLVGCQGVPDELTHKSRQSKGKAGGVIYMILYAAFLLAPGQSVLGTWGENPNNDLLDNGRYIIKDTRRLLFGDLSDNEAEKWSAFVVPQSHAVESTVLTRASFIYIPSAYIICTEDQACPPQFQQMFAAQAKSKVEELASGHSPHLSHLEQLITKLDVLVEDAIASQTS